MMIYVGERREVLEPAARRKKGTDQRSIPNEFHAVSAAESVFLYSGRPFLFAGYVRNFPGRSMR